MKTKRLFLAMSVLMLVMTVFCTIVIRAHSVGTTDPAHSQRLWTNTATKATYVASFLLVHKDEVFLEDAAGKVVAIPLQQLSSDDRAIAEAHRERIRAINQSGQPLVIQPPSVSVWKEVVSRYIPLALPVALGGMLLGLVFVMRHRRPSLKFAALAGVSFFVLAAVFVESQTTTTSIADAFAPFSAFIKTRTDNTYFYVESNGIPQHTMMVGIKSWQQQVPTLQDYSGTNAWSIPLKPTLAANPISTKTALYTGAIALAVNGVPIFNALNNRGDDALLFGELDNWGGHCGKADDYHYHTAPLHLQNIVGANKPIAYALDGFAIYGTNEPDGSAMKTLDSYNGHTGIDGVYHYHGTTTYPYTCGAMRGNVTVQNDQIVPQSRSTPIRPPYTPLNGAVITNCTAVGVNGYSLEYTLNGQKYYVNYSWTPQGGYTFVYVDAAGAQRTETFRGSAIALLSPALALSASTLAFGTVNIGASSVKLYTVSASNLTSPLTITSPSGFTISTSQTGTFSQTLTLAPVNTFVLQTVYVRFAPTAAGAVTGNITHISGSTALSSVAVSASASQSTNVAVSAESTEVRVFPNPASEQVTITLQANAGSDVRIMLRTVLGGLIATEHGTATSGSLYRSQLDMRSLAAGTYLVEVWTNNRVTRHSIVKR
jgi:hypothetical protein